MTAKTESSSRPADQAFAVWATLGAVVLFLVVWGVLHRGVFTNDPIVDTPVYEHYGSAMDDGKVPYRDFALEYPPGALPVFVVPALGDAGSETFRVRFEALMAFFGEAMIVCVAIALVALGAGDGGFLARARLRLVGADPARAGRSLAVRPLARCARRRRHGRARLGTAPPRARRARRRGRREALPGRARARLRSHMSGGARAGARRSSVRPCWPGSSPPSSRRFSSWRRAASGTASGTRLRARFRSRASARACSWSPITCSGPRSRWRRATARRTSPGRRPTCSPQRSRCSRRPRSSRSGSCSRAGRPGATGSSWRAAPPWLRSSWAARSSRRSS